MTDPAATRLFIDARLPESHVEALKLPFRGWIWVEFTISARDLDLFSTYIAA